MSRALGMSKTDAQPELVPRLRFPEFRDAPGWARMKLGDITTKTDRRNKDGRHLPVYSINNIVGFTPQGEQFEGVDSKERGYDLTLYKLIGRNTFAYNPARINVGSIGYSGSLDDIIISSLYVCFKAKSGADDQFLLRFFETTDFKRSVKNAAEGGIRSYLFYENFSIIGVPLPSPAEQQKIAACLGSLDDLIAAEGRKLAALRDHKKGLMQQLFPREGETRPRLRFPEFQDAAEWKVIPLAELLARDPQYGVNAAAVPYSEDLPAYIRITDIDDDGRYLPEGRVSVDIEATDDEYLQEGDIVLARTGASVGKSYRYRSEDGGLVFAGFLIRVRPEPKRLDSRFLDAFLSTGQYWDWVHITSARSGQPGINGTEYASMPLPVPPDGDSQGEQMRIADCLVSLDAMIAAQAAKLDALRTHKRGLMQQLFPSPEEAHA